MPRSRMDTPGPPGDATVGWILTALGLVGIVL